MEWDHVIINGTLVNAKESYPAHIYIKDGKIAAVSRETLGGEAGQLTDARGNYVLPGLIDTHVHSRDGLNAARYKEDFFHSTMAAACGGLTTVFEMPNTSPAIYNARILEESARFLEQKAHVDFALWGLALGNINVRELEDMAAAGAIAFKFFWGYAVDSNTYQLIYNYDPQMKDVVPPLLDGEIYDMFKVIAKTGKQVAVHAENFYLIKALFAEAERCGSDESYAAFLKCRPAEAECTTIRTAIAIAKLSGAKLHILHLGAGEGVDIIAAAQTAGLPVSVETCPHYLTLCDEDYPRVGPLMKVYPLVKTRRDMEDLWRGLSRGVISLVCSDHAPHTEEEKAGGLATAPAGMASVETLAPLMINAVSEGRLTINQLAAILSENPAKLYGLYPRKGSLLPGTDADITIIDPQAEYTIRKEDLHSISKVTPFDGWRVKGRAVQTILRGRTVAKDGQITGAPGGRFIKA
ncbi:MAG: dihydroorotase family protein [Clostridiales bacterium]|nr:dihydroorotase family protein [Clostridiales bacterium]